MFIGHHAIAFAAKPLAKRVPFAVLMTAPLLLDFLWPLFVLAGVERFHIEPGNTAVTPLVFDFYPWSHSFLTSIVWGVLFGLGYWLWKRDLRGSTVLALLVVSHWVFDAITHRPDLPLMPGSDVVVGLGLWHSIGGTIAVEGAIFAIGVALYVRATRPVARSGTLALWGFVAFVLLIYAASLLGPPPPNERAVAWSALAALLFPLWAGWFDRNRGAAGA